LFPDSFEVFHNNLVSPKIGNNVFADVVMNPSHVTSFPSRNFAKQSLTGMCAFGLKNRTQVFELSFDLLDFTGIIKPAVRTDGEVVNSEVNAQNNVLRTVVLLNGINLFREHKQEEAPAFFVDSEQAFFNFPSEIFSVARRYGEWNLNSAFDRGETQDITFERSVARKVVFHRALVYDWFGFGFLDHSAALFDASNSELALKVEASQLFVDKGVELNIILDAFIPCSVDTELQSFFVDGKSLNYLGKGFNLDLRSHNSSHKSIEVEQVFKTIGGFGDSSLQQDCSVSSPTTL